MRKSIFATICILLPHHSILQDFFTIGFNIGSHWGFQYSWLQLYIAQEVFCTGLKHFSFDFRVAGNSAFIIGTLAESEVGCFRVISLTKSKHKDSGRILMDLTKMLTFSDVESIMNAAGTMGTLVGL